MALTVDEILEKIGSLGLYQIRLIFILSYIEWFNITFQIMVPTFLSAEPKWMCVPHLNNTACNFTGEFTAVDKRRCDMPREAWTFTDDFTSVVTEVCSLLNVQHHRSCCYIFLKRQIVERLICAQGKTYQATCHFSHLTDLFVTSLLLFEIFNHGAISIQPQIPVGTFQ